MRRYCLDVARVWWYLRRLRTMSAREIAWRIGSMVRARIVPPEADSRLDDWTPEDWDRSLQAFRSAADRPRLLERDRAHDIADRSPGVVAGVIAAADRAVDLEVTYFGYPTVRLPRPVDWNHDPIGGVDWPVRASSTIDHRTFAGDPKWIWELNRLQHLSWLAQAWLFTDDDRYSDAAFEQLDSWLTHNPPGTGIAWRGAFEAGIRAISVALALDGLRDHPALGVDRYRAVVTMLDASARRCAADRSRFSSANNHLIGELAGLAVIAILHPDLPGAPGWEADAVAALVAQTDLQILADGVGAEQAVGYQIFTAELFLVVAALLGDRDGVAPPALMAAIDRGADFLTSVGEPAPRFGDDDEGFAIRLGPEPVRTAADHLDTVAGLHAGPGPDETTVARAWFARTGLAPVPRASIDASPTRRAPDGSAWFPDGGLVVLRSGVRRLTMDVGPLGFLAIAAHGHADALSVTVAHDGVDIIGDPGTGSYYGHPDWRTVMRGTAAHPTVGVDGADQSEMGGAFLWTRHARTRVRAVDLEGGIVDAEHRGYQRLGDPVVHRRWLIAPPGGDDVLVVDLVSGRGTHDIATTWPLEPALEATTIGNGHELRADGRPIARILTAASADTETYSVRGDVDTDMGWWSRRLETREPSWWVGARATNCALPFVYATFIDVTKRFELRYDLLVIHRDDRISVELSCEGVRRLYVIDTALDGRVHVTTE